MFIGRLCGYIICTLSMLGLAIEASAQPLEDVSLRYGEDGIVATITLSGPVRYLRHNPLNHGKTLEIYYDRLPDSSGVEWRDSDTLQSPPTSLIPSFTVTTQDQKIRPKLVIEFSRPAQFSVAPGSDNRSFQITIKPDKRELTLSQVIPLLPTVKPLAMQPVPATQAAAEVNQQAFEMMNAGRTALAGNDNSGAIEIFNKLLSLPPNPYTQDAQEWIGVARERAGQSDRAKAEYELYLKLYPQGEGVDRVKIRLAGLGKGAQESKPLMGGGGAETRRSQSMIYGGISSHYYRGSSTTDSTYLFNNVPTTTTNSATDQSMLVTTADATGRFVGDKYDNRLVFRDVQTHNYLPNTSGSSSYAQNTNRVYSAYWETIDRQDDYSVRLGRQSTTGAGVLGRYDGVSGSYGNPDDWRVHAVMGRNADFSSLSKPTFYGTSVDRGPVSLYVINQSVEGVLDRRAIGIEEHYFKSGNTSYAQVDYDVSFRALNIAMLNSTLAIGNDGSNINFIVDHRRTPSLSISNALIGATTTSVSTLLQQMTENQLRSLAQARTATSDFSQIGFTHPLSKQWLVGSDLKFSRVSGLPASGTNTVTGILVATPGTGLQRTLTVQLIGNNLMTASDTWSASLNLMRGENINGQSLYMYNRTITGQKWTMDTAWLYYKQDSLTSGNIVRNTPSIRTTYQYANQLSFDGEIGLEMTRTTGSTQNLKTRRTYGALGFNLNF